MNLILFLINQLIYQIHKYYLNLINLLLFYNHNLIHNLLNLQYKLILINNKIINLKENKSRNILN